MPHPFDLDLNQLRVLDALLQEGTVSGAARRLGKPQSSVSTTLGRLREALDDPLLTRAGAGMQPTPRAMALREPLQDMLAHVARVLSPAMNFDPATSSREFTLAASDYTQFVLAPPLMEAIAQEAPGVRLRIQAIGQPAPWALLGDGRLDLLLGGRLKAPEGLRSRRLFDDAIVCLLQGRHPAARIPWNLDAYLGLEHVEVQSSQGPTLADQTLTELGLSRRVRLIVPHFLVAPFVVQRTDLCFTLARRIAEPLARLLPFKILPLPFASSTVSIRAYWHPRMQGDPGHRWLREKLSHCLPSPP